MTPSECFQLQMDCLNIDIAYAKGSMLTGEAYDAFLLAIESEMGAIDMWLQTGRGTPEERAAKIKRQEHLDQIYANATTIHEGLEPDTPPWMRQEAMNKQLDTSMPSVLAHSLLTRAKALFRGRTDDPGTLVETALSYAQSKEGESFLLGRAKIFVDEAGFDYGADFEVAELRNDAVRRLRDVLGEIPAFERTDFAEPSDA